MHALARWLVCLSLMTAAASADELDVLDKAKTTFQGTVTKQHDLLKTAFEKAMKDASKAGKLEEIEELNQELQSFVQSKAQPKSPRIKAAGQKYFQTVNTAFGKLTVAYEKAIKAETKDQRIREAQELRAELDELKANLGIGKESDYPIEIVSAIWKFDGKFGNGDATEDVKAKIEQSLKSTKTLVVGGHTLGNLTGQAATKAVDMQVKVGGAALAIRLGEGSEIHFDEISVGDEKAKGMRFGKSGLELLSASIEQRGGGAGPFDKSQACWNALLNGPIKASGAIFAELGENQPKQLTIKFRVNKNALTLKLSESSVLQISTAK